ncbi:MAG TPA: WGR domain-containing protein [Kofleriaceae bacterium]|nr:WGR domain-containing protein [Kofleriaceae bacterium]
MPRYEFSEGTSNKFWQIDLSGKSFTTKYGKIGTPGQQTLKEFKTDAEAKKEYDKLVAEKVKKGYMLVGGGGDADDEEDEDEAPPAKKSTKAAPAKTAAKTAKAPAKAAAKPASTGSNGDRSTPRYFEFSEGTSNKFWQIHIDGTSVLTKYGKIGASGQTTMKALPNEAAAIKEYDKLVNEKTKKGYEEKDAPDED